MSSPYPTQGSPPGASEAPRPTKRKRVLKGEGAAKRPRKSATSAFKDEVSTPAATSSPDGIIREGSIQLNVNPKTPAADGEGEGSVAAEDEAPDDDDYYEDEEVQADRARKDRQEAVRALVKEFDDEQLARYEEYRRCNLPKDKVRRLVNVVLQQSVAPIVQTAVRGLAKVFVGEIVEDDVFNKLAVVPALFHQMMYGKLIGTFANVIVLRTYRRRCSCVDEMTIINLPRTAASCVLIGSHGSQGISDRHICI